MRPTYHAYPYPRRSTRFLSVEDKGVYVLPDGSTVRVKATQDGERTYALRWTEIPGTRLTAAGEKVQGEFRYEQGLIGVVARHGRKMTLPEARHFLLMYGICARCGALLKAADSVERGIGPVCRTYFEGKVTGARILQVA